LCYQFLAEWARILMDDGLYLQCNIDTKLEGNELQEFTCEQLTISRSLLELQLKTALSGTMDEEGSFITIVVIFFAVDCDR